MWWFSIIRRLEQAILFKPPPTTNWDHRVEQELLHEFLHLGLLQRSDWVIMRWWAVSARAATAGDQRGALPVLPHSGWGERDEEIQAPTEVVYRLANVLQQQSRQSLTATAWQGGCCWSALFWVPFWYNSVASHKVDLNVTEGRTNSWSISKNKSLRFLCFLEYRLQIHGSMYVTVQSV